MNIVIIDDRQSFLDDFQIRYDNPEKGITIETFRTMEEASPELDKNFYEYDFVILDGKGHRKIDETGDGSEYFARDMLDVINDLIRSKKRDLPFCYYTAYANDEFLKELGEKCYFGTTEKIGIFKKSLGEEEEKRMFQFIREKVSKNPESSIKQNYHDVWEVFDMEYLDKKYERDFLNCIKLLKDLTDDNAINFARNVRPMIEAICSKIRTLDRKFLEIMIKSGNEQSLRGALKFLAGTPTYNQSKGYTIETTEVFLPKHLYLLISAIQDSSSTVVMHPSEYTITKYTAQTYLNGLLDFFIWFKELTKKNLTKS